MALRMIAGRFKGRRLVGPSGGATRPTSDRLRETLFNVVADRVSDARVLDAFAGTGALGLEALSRGAASVVFVEADRRACADISRNVAACQATPACTIVPSTFARYLARRRPRAGRSQAAPAPAGFDLVLLDPPYEATDLAEVLAGAAEVVGAGAQVILEYSRRRSPPAEVAGLALRRTLTAGDSALAFYDTVYG